MSKYAITLVRVKRTNPEYQAIRDRHYVANRGTHGQQLHYLIALDLAGTCGIISGASSVFGVRARDEFFGLTPETKKTGLNSIVNNTVFRLELHLPNLATQVLALWRRRVAIDWKERYGVQVHGFETFVVEEDFRKGALYRADNWAFVGTTLGRTKAHTAPEGMCAPQTWGDTSPKLIFVKKIPNTKLATEYHPTWRRGGQKPVGSDLA